MSEWCNSVLKTALSGYSHLLNSTEDFRRRLEKLELSEDDVMIQIDIEAFFMSGLASELTELASGILEDTAV